MATTSYLQEMAGGMVAAAAFEDDDAAVTAVTLLRESGVNEQDISVIARDRRRAELIAGDRAWLPGRGWTGLMARLQKLINGHIDFMCSDDRLNNSSAESRENAVNDFHQCLVERERELGRIRESLQLS